MLPSGARKCTQAFPLSSTPDSKRIATPADRSSAVASWMSSTRNPATGPVVRWRLIGLSGPKISTLLPSGSLSIQNPGWSNSSRRPRTSRKKATVGAALLVRVPTQASLMICILEPLPEVGLDKRSPGLRYRQRLHGWRGRATLSWAVTAGRRALWVTRDGQHTAKGAVVLVDCHESPAPGPVANIGDQREHQDAAERQH